MINYQVPDLFLSCSSVTGHICTFLFWKWRHNRQHFISNLSKKHLCFFSTGEAVVSSAQLSSAPLSRLPRLSLRRSKIPFRHLVSLIVLLWHILWWIALLTAGAAQGICPFKLLSTPSLSLFGHCVTLLEAVFTQTLSLTPYEDFLLTAPPPPLTLHPFNPSCTGEQNSQRFPVCVTTHSLFLETSKPSCLHTFDRNQKTSMILMMIFKTSITTSTGTWRFYFCNTVTLQPLSWIPRCSGGEGMIGWC